MSAWEAEKNFKLRGNREKITQIDLRWSMYVFQVLVLPVNDNQIEVRPSLHINLQYNIWDYGESKQMSIQISDASSLIYHAWLFTTNH